jgi:eukaryotic-like serine/threonine-protein kinase
MRPPERIGRYRVQSVIGVGGFAVVFRAHDEVLDDAVAIKVLAENWVADAEIRERFLEEARLLRRIRNDNLVTVHDVGELEGERPYFVMEFAKRGTLADRLATRGGAGLDPASARRLATALADGMGEQFSSGTVSQRVGYYLARRVETGSEPTGATRPWPACSSASDRGGR